MKKIIIAILFLVFLMASVQFTSAEGKKHEMPPPYVGSEQFEKLKTLSGKWVGTHQMGEDTVEAVVVYDITSNDSAVVETMAPGTPGEMISVYHDEGDKVSMTHYCAIANQPKLSMVNSSRKHIQFEFSKENTIDPATEGHMHGLTITFNDDGTIQHEWVMFEEGKEAGRSIIQLTKVDQ